MTIRELLRHAGETLGRAGSGYVEHDAARGCIRLKEKLVQLGAERARRSDEGLHELRVTITDALHVEARIADGYRVSADVVPIALDVRHGAVRLRASVPGGPSVSHDDRLRSLLARTLDATLGVVNARLHGIAGLTLDGEALTWERKIDALTLLRSTGILEADTTIPLRCEPGALVLDVAGLSARLDWSRIAAALLAKVPR